jgi:protein-L-isoaspartate(D-aspartate) O-methyltransferase
MTSDGAAESEAAVRLAARVAASVRDPRVLEAIRRTPRHRFVPAGVRPYAYRDEALSIGHGQTISQPTIVGVMSEALALTGDERVLDVGTGSGYQAAILAHLAREVVTVEIVDALRERAAELLRDLGYDNVTVLPAGDDLGAPQRAPFEAILVAAAAPGVPPPLVEQLAMGGRIVIPIGRRDMQDLVVAQRTESGLERRSLGPCRFVPLVGPYGFSSP